jgi:RNA polymerase sigma-70 factor (ECF subfamily)
VLTAFSKNLEGDLDPKTCAELQRHLDACPSCRGACDSLKRTLAACARVSAGPVSDAVKRSVRAALRAALAVQA